MQIWENIAAVAASTNEDHDLYIPRRSQQLGLCYCTTAKILRRDLGRPTYSSHIARILVYLVQEQKPWYLLVRRIFAEWAA